ncbi:hypothetical protein GCM10010260_81960 [Streptomyces filipinensis]|uniref:Uncharacterized protein n=1 Tax=Streptomyces filipinensis TaxID=66887 RepID=A0A918IK65_9ACTN|nr:hypothetical protein [Streptomyces filipinensis]GGV29079.1 hypothetical protein GCM10010260_81960 [Streptomyces filipinensis]
MADHPAPRPLPDPPGVPSRDLRLRADHGLATFLARWEDPPPASVDHQDDADGHGER